MLYTGPIPLAKGTTLESQAFRLGYKSSAIVKYSGE
jgi:hypothetical protein